MGGEEHQEVCTSLAELSEARMGGTDAWLEHP